MSVGRALLIVVVLSASACGVEVGVNVERADRIAPALEGPGQDDAPPSTDTSEAPATTQPPTAPPSTSEPVAGTLAPPTSSVPVDPPPVDPAAIDFGPNKPPQPYDDFLLAAVSDIEAWWAEQFPLIYGAPFEPLTGGVIAAYPDRPDDIPGCGTPRTTYVEVTEFAAFYCGIGDFMVYDDGDDGLLADLADRFGPATIAVVLAHEYGHAIQLRTDALESDLPTIATEQQADCFAGAWAARATTGGAAVTFSDSDVRVSLISMLEVRDPVGLNQFSQGGHGSGFDRVGAFQVGFLQGVARCTELLDDPLPLAPSQFANEEDRATGGNAPWGYEEGQLFNFLLEDLNLYWDGDLGEVVPGFEPLELIPVQSRGEVTCDRLDDSFEVGVALCPDPPSVYVNEPAAFDLYSQTLFGDFSIGYLLGVAWSDAAQGALGSTLTGEARELLNDCLTGAWVATTLPMLDRTASERSVSISPGDLDETVRTMILIGDDRAGDDDLGTPFEKVASFRSGLIEGLDTCLAAL